MRISVQIEFDKTMDIETSKSSVTLGRASLNDVVVPHESISRNHCLIELIEGVIYLTDLGSSNGTFINGKRIDANKRTPIPPASPVALGKLDCEISDGGLTEDHVTKAIKIVPNKDATTTMRIARLDLNKPSITLEMEKKIQVKGPRNPITEGIKPRPKQSSGDGKKLYIVLFVIIGLIVLYLISHVIKER